MKKQQLRRKINRARFLLIDLEDMVNKSPTRTQAKTLINEILEVLADDTKVTKY